MNQLANLEQLNEMMASGSKMVLKFWADWCNPCKMVSPVLDQVEAECPGVSFLGVNVDEHPEVVQKFGIRGIPTIIIIDKGETQGIMAGVSPRERYLEAILGG